MGTTYNYGDFVTPIATAAARATCDVLAMPFDMVREHYSRSVQAGLIERSLLKSAQFGRTLNALEKLTLGPWARTL
jgi:hypothetical protein